MNKYVLLLWLWLMGIAAQAQNAGFTLVKNITALQLTLSKTNAATKTITSDFNQVKNMKLLSETLKSKGKFYYKQPERMRIQYNSPYSYIVVYQGGQMTIRDEKKTNKVNTRNSKSLQSLNRIMIDAMSGTVFSNKDFKVSALENNKQYLLQMLPIDASMKRIFKQIEVYLDKGKLNVARLVMTEVGGDVTEMTFLNTQTNSAIDDALFKIK